ncbi:tyrosine-type recombinase/integrase [Mucilaginibacter sp. UR6-1]|uniref:tyrosine-type recombinase/integrase n=1 Tax=Mucilaginibacter sp. UR6-1 TaxID=1435643 RepID=UPI001E6044A1|nr:tyrosine-type recombinase/integrase [Mucilaginibacter sp. UR6-1]MCC8409887.1 tyrosine-type recombinase/integrase [Mucilaginibacter sp. UR6-1]
MERKKETKQSGAILIQTWETYEFKLHPGSKPYISFYFINPDTGVSQRIRKMTNLKPGSSLSVLKTNAKDTIEVMVDWLSKGWNPITDNFKDRPLSPLSTIDECLDYWLKEREKQRDNKAMKPKSYELNSYLVRYFKTWLQSKSYLQRKPQTFTRIDIDSFLQHTANLRKWNKVSYNCYRTDLGTFFNYLKTLKLITENPVIESVKKNTRKDSSRFKIYESSELHHVVKLLENDKSYFGLFVASKLVFHYNIRPVEISRIQICDIDFTKKQLTLPPAKTKNGCEAIFQLNDDMYNLLDELTAGLPESHFVFGHRCKPGAEQIHQDYFGQKWRMFRKKYKIPKHLKLYALKHSSNYFDIENGASYEEIRQRNRHANLQVTTLYVRERLLKNIIQPSASKMF